MTTVVSRLVSVEADGIVYPVQPGVVCECQGTGFVSRPHFRYAGNLNSVRWASARCDNPFCDRDREKIAALQAAGMNH